MLQLLQKLNHPWVNQYNQVVGHPKLMAWSKDTDLPTLLAETLAELQQPQGQTRTVAPPSYEALVPSSATVPQPAPALPPAESTHAAEPPPTPAARRQPTDDFEVPTPPVPHSFPAIEAMELAELERLVGEDDVAWFIDFVNKQPSVQAVQEMRCDAIKANSSVAAETLARREQLEEARAKAIAVSGKLSESKADFDFRLKSRLAIDGKMSSDEAILRELEAAAAAEEASSDRALESFCDKEFEV